MIHACTIVARNYLAHARVLARTFLEWHPGSTFHTLVLDPGPPLRPEEEPFELVVPADLFTAEEWGPLWYAYSVLELATAVKPRLLGFLLDRYGETASYFDPDIRFYRPMEWLEGVTAEHDAVLVPHTVHPIPRDGRTPEELFILRAGVYNLGFVSVGQKGRPFLDWWWERLKRQCLVAPHQGIFVDQRWVDFAPALFDCHLIKDVTVNVAYWNAGSRLLTISGDGYLVDGEPLTFFHFSGYNPRVPWLLSKYGGLSPRVLLSESPALRRLCDGYAAELEAAGYGEASQCHLDQDTLPNGVVLDQRARTLYRNAVAPANPAHRVEGVPNPLIDPDEFIGWLKSPGDPHHPPWLSRYLFDLHRNTRALLRAFRRVPGKDNARYLEWIRDHGPAAGQIPAALMPPEDAVPSPGVAAQPVGEGINLVGHLRAEIGVGEASRQIADVVESLGVPLATFDAVRGTARREHGFRDRRPVPGVINPYDVNIICVNAMGTRRFAAQAGPGFFAGRYTVGYWAWELEEFPDSWPDAFEVVDEIWMNSEFAATGVRRRTAKPVEAFPVPVGVPVASILDRRTLGLPDGFVFLFVFDYASIFERKNPVGLVRAFRQAFAPGEGPVLALKSINEENFLTKREWLRHEVGGRPDIVLLEGYLSPGDKNALMGACDCYVSLHRSEGFGITMAEAMALGKPTIATGYSGNLEFMTPENSFLVGFEEGRVPPGCGPYPAGAKWAEPDVDQAAVLMRRVYLDPEGARRVGEQARADMARLHGLEARAELLAKHLNRIRAGRAVAVVGGNPIGDPPGSVGAGGSEAAPGRSIEGPLSALRQAAERAVRSELPRSLKRRSLRSLLARLAYRLVRPYARRGQAADERLLRYVAALDARVAELTAEARLRGETSDEGRRRREDGPGGPAGGLEPGMTRPGRGPKGTPGAPAGNVPVANPGPISAGVLTARSRDGRAVLGFGARSVGWSADRGNGLGGPEEGIPDRQGIYQPLLRGFQPMLEIGAGLGDSLDLAAAGGLDVSGVDADATSVAWCREKGERVAPGDALAHLRHVGEESLGSIVALRSIEYLASTGVTEFLRLCLSRLRPGGLAVVETVNPRASRAPMVGDAGIDDTLPLYPEVLLAIAQAAGFEEGLAVFPTGCGDLEADLAGTGVYAVVLRKGGVEAEPLADLVCDALEQGGAARARSGLARPLGGEPAAPRTGEPLRSKTLRVAGKGPAPSGEAGERVCYLHIGLHKTASTTMQRMVLHNVGRLADLGIYVPQVSTHHYYKMHHELAAELNSSSDPPRTRRFDRLRDELHSRGLPSRVLLSSEDFSRRIHQGEVREALQGFFDALGYRLRLIVYLRPQDLSINSTYVQHARSFVLTEGFAGYWQSVLQEDPPWFDYWRLLEPALDDEGLDCDVRPFHRATLEKGVEEDFLGAVGVPEREAARFEKVPPANRSPGPKTVAACLEIARRLAGEGLVPRPTQRQRLYRGIERAAAASGWDESSFCGLTPEAVERIRAHFARGNDLLSRRAWGRAWAEVFSYEIAQPVTPNRFDPGTASPGEREEFFRLVDHLWEWARVEFARQST